MEIKQQYVQRYLHDIAVDQLVADYQAKGYAVSTEEKIDGKYQADLVARQGDEVIVVEVKTGRFTSDRRKRIAEIGDYVRAHRNYKFLVVLANPPKQKKINIPNLDQLLSAYLIYHFSDSLNALSTRTRITNVSEVVVDEVVVRDDGGVSVKGSATVSVSLSSGPSDDVAESTDSFPLTFDLLLSRSQGNELTISQVNTLDVDTTSFYD